MKVQNIVRKLHRKLVSGGVPWQTKRFPHEKFRLIQPELEAHQVNNLLDIGCNAGVITRLAGEAGFFSVGIDQRVDIRGLEHPLSLACIGEVAVDDAVIERLPLFDAILLFSVHHQWVAEHDDQYARDLLRKIAGKAKKLLFVEFAAISSKYGYAENQHFQENDERSVKEYAEQWLAQALEGWHFKYLGKVRESGREPYRFTYVCERINDS